MEMRRVIVSIAVNNLLSWTVLPLMIPPFRVYTLVELGEVLFWQVIGAVGWPIVLLGGCANFILQGTLSDLGTLALMLIYPGILVLLIRVYVTKRFWHWEFVLLHFLIIISFFAVWYQVLNGYDFMVG